MATAEERYEQSKDPSTPSPFTPTPGVCGHCGNAENTETQGHGSFCYKCGKFSTAGGEPIEGRAHFRGNTSETFPWANRHGTSDFE